MSILQIGIEQPFARGVGVDQVEHLAVRQRRRRRQRVLADRRQLALADHRQRIRIFECVGQQSRNAVVAAREIAIGERHGRRQRSRREIDLHAAVDGILLIPQQPALDIQIFERISIFSALQRWQRTDCDAEVRAGHDLDEALRDWSEEAFGRAPGAAAGGADCLQIGRAERREANRHPPGRRIEIRRSTC